MRRRDWLKNLLATPLAALLPKALRGSTQGSLWDGETSGRGRWQVERVFDWEEREVRITYIYIVSEQTAGGETQPVMDWKTGEPMRNRGSLNRKVIVQPSPHRGKMG